jgi:hypothetical protein
LPPVQGLHAVAPLSDWYVPPSHGVHSDWYAGRSPSPLPDDDSPLPDETSLPESLKVPAEHGVGSVEPVAHAEPAGHPVHSEALVSAVAFEYVPLLHGSSADAPAGQ